MTSNFALQSSGSMKHGLEIAAMPVLQGDTKRSLAKLLTLFSIYVVLIEIFINVWFEDFVNYHSISKPSLNSFTSIKIQCLRHIFSTFCYLFFAPTSDQRVGMVSNPQLPPKYIEKGARQFWHNIIFAYLTLCTFFNKPHCATKN